MKNFTILVQILQDSTLLIQKGLKRRMSSKAQNLLDVKMINELNNYPLRILDSKFKFKFDPLYWKAKEFWPEFTSKLFNNDRNAMNTVKHAISPIFVGLFWPENKSVKQFKTLTNFCDFFFLFDDFRGIEKSVEGLENLLSVIDGKTYPTEPLEILIDYVLTDISPNYREESMAMSRLRRSIYDYVYICLEAFKDNDETKYTCIEDYFEESRMITIGVIPCINFIPYSTGINVDKYLSDKRLIECEKIINRNIILNNDYYSCKKEMAENDAHLQFNCFVFLYRKYHDLDKSFDFIQNYIVEHEIEFFKLKSSLLEDYQNDTDLHRYIDGLEYISSGAYIFHLIAPRYKSNKIPIDCVLSDDYIDLKNELKYTLK